MQRKHSKWILDLYFLEYFQTVTNGTDNTKHNDNSNLPSVGADSSTIDSYSNPNYIRLDSLVLNPNIYNRKRNITLNTVINMTKVWDWSQVNANVLQTEETLVNTRKVTMVTFDFSDPNDLLVT